MVSNPQIRTRIGERIRTRRLELGISQVKLAAMLGINRILIIKYERGNVNPRAENLPSLAEALQVPINYFFDEVPPEVPVCKDSAKPKAKSKT